MTLSKRMTSLCITLVVASLFLSIYASAASAPIHKTTVWVAPETETLINGIPESQTPMVTDVIMGPYFTDTITIKRQLLTNIDILHTSHMITD